MFLLLDVPHRREMDTCQKGLHWKNKQVLELLIRINPGFEYYKTDD